MPFPLIPSTLGIAFLLIWMLIGGMMFRDSQLAARENRVSEDPIRPGAERRPRLAAARRSSQAKQRRTARRVQIAS